MSNHTSKIGQTAPWPQYAPSTPPHSLRVVFVPKGAAIKTYVSYNTPWTLTCDDAGVVFDPPTDMDGYYLETGEIPVTITIPENDTTEDKTYIIVLHRFYEAQEYSTATYRLLQAGKKR